MTGAAPTPLHTSTSLPAAIRRQVACVLLAGLGNYACGWLGYTLVAQPSGVAIVWPGSGFLLALLLLLPRRDWTAVAVGALFGNVFGDLAHNANLIQAIAGSVANVVEGLVAAALLVRLLGRGITLGTLREVSGFVLGAVIFSNAATALLGGLVLTRVGTHFWRGWFVWWTGDGMGMLMFAPPILTWAHVLRSRKQLRWWPTVEATLVCLAVVAIGLVLHPGAGSVYSLVNEYPYLAFPLLFWCAVRLGPASAATATLILCLVTEWNAAHSVGPFAGSGPTPVNQVFAIYLYLALAGFSSLIPAAMLSERRRTEAKLRESERRFREMADHINEAFLVVNLATGSPIYVSPTWAQIWGRPIADGYDPRIWLEAIHAEDRAVMEQSQNAMARGESSDTRFRVIRPDGTLRWVRGRFFPVRDGTGRVYRMVGVAEDVTELRQVEQQFAQAQRLEAVGRLAGGVAHDFNNLLTVILGYVEMLLAETPLGLPRHDELLAIQTAGTSASRLTRQLLLFSRKEVQQPEVLQLNDVISGTGKMLSRLIGEHIELVTALDRHAGTVKVDRGSIEQLIVNLAVNARDAMPHGGTLTIESRNATIADGEAAPPGPPGRYVMLIVRDTGTGMDEATKARAFEPFFTTKGQGKGTGLGLATVYGVVQQSGGFIALDSAPGRGTRFTIYLPRVDEPVAAPGASERRLPRGRGETVLVAEDEPAVRSLVRRVLVTLGYVVLEAPDGEQALALAKAHRGAVDLLLTDVVMPRMSGRVLADHFAEVRPTTRVLFMSGYTDDAVLHAGVLTREMRYIEKPLTPSALAIKVRETLDAPR